MSKVENKAKGSSSSDANHGFAERSSLYKEFLAEREEILKHKWLESEKRGEDIGFERALLDWIRKHRATWRKGRKSEVCIQK
ncbi:MAG: hypothetical protein ACPGSB_07495 [Opitutales bacterium]